MASATNLIASSSLSKTARAANLRAPSDAFINSSARACAASTREIRRARLISMSVCLGVSVMSPTTATIGLDSSFSPFLYCSLHLAGNVQAQGMKGEGGAYELSRGFPASRDQPRRAVQSPSRRPVSSGRDMTMTFALPSLLWRAIMPHSTSPSSQDSNCSIARGRS